MLNQGPDPATDETTVRAAIDNADDRLRPGMSFAVSVTLPAKPFPNLTQWKRMTR